MLKSLSKHFLASIIIFLAIMLISVFVLVPKITQSTDLSFQEAPLHKISTLKLYGGEEYLYTYVSSGSNVNISYLVVDKGNCIELIASISLNDTSVCLSREKGTDETGSNITFSNPLIFMFRPWMLAVKDEWTWNVTSKMKLIGSELDISTLYFSVNESTKLFGRDSYKVTISNNKDPERMVLMWIDTEKRILLRETGQNQEGDVEYMLTLVEAPFPLEQQEE